MRTLFKTTETFQYTFFASCHPSGVKKGFVKDEALRLLRTNSSIKTFEENITKFKKHLMERGYPQNFINNALSEVKSEQRTQASPAPTKRNKKRILPFITRNHPAVPNLKETFTRKWYLIQQQPLLNPIFKEPPIISYRKGRSLKDVEAYFRIFSPIFA